MLTFRFRHSRSEDLPWLIELAKRGTFNELSISSKHIVYETAFELEDPLQLGHALSLATVLVHQKTAEAFVGRQSLLLPMVREVLRCYQQSQQAEEPHAFCWFPTLFRFDVMVTPDTIDVDRSQLLFPCRLAAREAGGLHRDQPGAMRQQVDATLLRAGTRWCPRLADLTDWERAANLISKEVQ
jgi:hypothetical protein